MDIIIEDKKYHISHEQLEQAVLPIVFNFIYPKVDTPEDERINRLMRTSMRGFLLMFGKGQLQKMLGKKDVPQPSKQDDPLLWYGRMIIAHILKSFQDKRYLIETEGTHVNCIRSVDGCITPAQGTEDHQPPTTTE